MSNPSSPDYGHYLSPAQFRARYSPRSSQVTKVKRWLTSHGFDVTDVSKSRMLVSATGTAGKVDRAFSTSLKVFKSDGQRLRAPAEPVSIPAKLSGDIVGVAGLAEEPAQPLGISADTAPGAPPPAAFRNAGPCSHYWARRYGKKMPAAYGKTQPWATCGYRPHQLEGAYGVRGAIKHGNDGSGQTVAIIDAFVAPTIRKDVNTYSRRHGLPPVKLKQKVFHGCHHACDEENRQGWYGEETLDLEAVHLMAPGAKIHYVGAADSTFQLVRALGWAVDHRVGHVITNSYGHVGEAVSKIHIRVEERIHQEAIAEGIGIYFSSGDDGDESHVIGHPATDYPASSPKVTAVGGTTLGVGPRNNYRFETGWGTHVTGKSGTTWDPTPPGGFLYGSGGGTTRLFSEPGYQKGVVPKKLAQRFGGHGRVVPDISMDGDPNSGMLEGETQTFPNGKKKYGEYRIGGTEPLLAAVRGLHGPGRPEGALPPRLPQSRHLPPGRGPFDPGHQPRSLDRLRAAPRLQQRCQQEGRHLGHAAHGRHGHVAAHEEGLRRRDRARSAPWRSPAEGAPPPLGEIPEELRLSRATRRSTRGSRRPGR